MRSYSFMPFGSVSPGLPITRWLFFAKSPISEPEPRSSASFGTPGGLSRYMACSVPEKGVSGTEYPICTPEACFEHGGFLKTHRVHQEAFLSTARIFRTGGGLLQYGMQPDMLNCSRCELLSDFLSLFFEHNNMDYHLYCVQVVNCFQIFYLCSSNTTLSPYVIHARGL